MSTFNLDQLVEVVLPNAEAFLKIKETLTRMGISVRKADEKTLVQSCHILFKDGRYFLVHFKELFKMDGRESDVSDEDLDRRDRVIMMLKSWGMLEIHPDCQDMVNKESQVGLAIIPFREKNEWKLVAKYSLGKKPAKKGDANSTRKVGSRRSADGDASDSAED